MSKPIGCGDHGCIFGHPGGMGTNGGCHCLDSVRDIEDRVRIRHDITQLRVELAASHAAAGRMRAALERIVEKRTGQMVNGWNVAYELQDIARAALTESPAQQAGVEGTK